MAPTPGVLGEFLEHHQQPLVPSPNLAITPQLVLQSLPGSRWLLLLIDKTGTGIAQPFLDIFYL